MAAGSQNEWSTSCSRASLQQQAISSSRLLTGCLLHQPWLRQRHSCNSARAPSTIANHLHASLARQAGQSTACPSGSSFMLTFSLRYCGFCLPILVAREGRRFSPAFQSREDAFRLSGHGILPREPENVERQQNRETKTDTPSTSLSPPSSQHA